MSFKANSIRFLNTCDSIPLIGAFTNAGKLLIKGILNLSPSSFGRSYRLVRHIDSQSSSECIAKMVPFGNTVIIPWMQATRNYKAHKLYWQGKGMLWKDSFAGVSAIKQAANLGFLEAQKDLGKRMLQQKQYQKAHLLFLKVLDQGGVIDLEDIRELNENEFRF